MGELKPGWRRVKFGEVVRLVSERCDPVNSGIERFVGLEHIEPGDLSVRSWGDVADGTTFTNRFRPGQVLFGKRRAYQRKVAVANFDGVCSGDIYVLESADPERLVPELLPFICQTNAFFEHAVGTSAGSLSPRTNWASLAEYKFALPPMDEQRRYVQYFLRELEVEETLRRAVISAKAVALAGPLELMGMRTMERSGKLLDSIRLPRDWKFARLSDFAEDSEKPVQVGPFGGTLASRHFVEEGVEVLKVQNVGYDGFVDRSSFVYVNPGYAESLERYQVRENDILVVAQGFTSGRTAMVMAKDSGAITSQHLIRIRVNPKLVNPRWLWVFMRSPFFEEQVAPVMMKTTRPGLNTEDILLLTLPVPPLADQEELANQVVRLLNTPSEIVTRVRLAAERRMASSERFFTRGS